jgi:erythromycin esterase
MEKYHDPWLYTSEDILKEYQKLETSKDLDPLIDRIGNARYVLLGEASHGTHEFYTWRAAISKRLIEEKGFSFIAVEGDWPDCYKINRFVKGYADTEAIAVDVLRQFKRWPTWMWANWEITAFAEWIRQHNKKLHPERKVGFYGLDVYSLWESLDVMAKYLQNEDPKAAELLTNVINCFEPYVEREQEYAQAVYSKLTSCKNEVVKLLREIRKNASHYDGDREAGLNAEMNALVAADAERYYTAMVDFNDNSWNVRDAHMVSTLNSLMKFHGRDAKVIVWEHNTHVGDARATDMQSEGLYNVGQLVRQEHQQEEVVIVGFSSYEGTVIAGERWGGEMQVMEVPKARNGSVEDMLHTDSPENKLLILNSEKLKERFKSWKGHRAIGVVYRPGTELGNYVPTILPSRYDALLYIDKTKALFPLHIRPDGHLIPETYPFGF